MASYQYIYVMQNLTKVFPGGKELFKGITLSFFPGAKIGVLGVNGAGKSTLLKIMAGVDKEFNGEAWPAEGVKVGYLDQHAVLTAGMSIKDALASAFDPLYEMEARMNELYEKMGFRIYGIRPNAIKLKDGRLLNEYLMIKEL